MCLRFIFSIFCFLNLMMFHSLSGKEQKESQEAVIRSKSAAFEKAFNAKDPKAIASLWAVDASYIDPETGTVLEGREAIEEDYRLNFAREKKRSIRINIDKITFPTQSEAIESGTAVISDSDAERRRTAYRAFYGKINGEWLITEIREVSFDYPPSQYAQLKSLEWLVGHWVDEDRDTKIESRFRWDKYKNFLTQYFSVFVEGQKELEGKQIIAWDPIQKKIRSWLFDSDGTYGEGTWQKQGERFIVETAQTLADGRRASSINIYTPLGENRYSFESTGRMVDGVVLPDIKPVTVEKK